MVMFFVNMFALSYFQENIQKREMPHSMQQDTSNATTKYPLDELLIFIGHSDDASAEALAIKSLQSEVQKDFCLLLKTNRNHSPFRRIKLWEWTFDALAIPGGQETVITPALDHAQIAIFIFRERVGKVTWQELEKARERSTTQSLHILAFFPESDLHQGKFPNDQAALQASRDRTTLLERKVELTTFWTNCNGRSVSPLTYQNTEKLKAIVLEKLKDSIADILAVESPGSPFDALKKPDAKSMLRRYHAAIKEELGYIRMLGLPGVESIKVNLNDDTFVPLRLSDRPESGFHPGKQETRQVRDRVEEMLNPDEVMQRAFNKRRMLLVIGDPGSGKTTLIKYYALCALEADHFKRLGFAASVNVFYLPLRDLVRHEKGHYDTLPANFARWSEKHHQPIDATFFDEWLRHGTPLILLDGLDEISNTQDRIEVCQWIDAALHTFTTARFVVTSRATGYRKDEGIELAADYERADVQDFTVEQQERFLKNWFTEVFLKEPCPKDGDETEWPRLQRAEAEERTQKMVAHLKEEKNKGLRQLAAIPMILQIMAILWKDSDYIPENRLKVYEVSLNYLLEFRDKRRGVAPLLSADHARLVLGPVSLWMQETLKKDEVVKTEMNRRMREGLETLDDPPTAEVFCDYLVKRSGLLVENGGKEYLFRHKSFREYLTGVQLKEGDLDKHLNNLVSYFGEDWWEEPLRFFIASVDANVFDAFMQKLFDSPVSEALKSKQKSLLLLHTIIAEAKGKKVDALCKKLLEPATTTERQWVIIGCLKAIGKPSALDALKEFRVNKLAKNKNVADRAEEVILALGGQLSHVQLEKSGSGTIISIRNPHEDNAEYILIPGGNYQYSVTEKIVNVPDVYFAKYPVTNKQYCLFIDWLGGNGLDNSNSLRMKFDDELQRNARRNAGFLSYLSSGKDDRVALFRSSYAEDRKFSGNDQPVVGITWYAAWAYCLWLSLLYGNGGKTDVYHLPNEQEWEWAAGGQRGTTGQKVRKYPWSNEYPKPNPKLLNYSYNEGVTTPVGSYSEGATPEGLYDMAGNIYEWTNSWWNDTQSHRVLRGGNWESDAALCTSSFRFGLPPGDFRGGVGFRLKFVP